jgi:hypothetical protein
VQLRTGKFTPIDALDEQSLPARDFAGVSIGAMVTTPAVVDVSNKSVTLDGITYAIQELAEDSFTVLVKGVPVGRIVYTFGAANGVSEGNAVSEDTMYAIAEAWFGATG